MKFPFSWLKEISHLNISAHQTADILTSLGIEVEALGETEDHDFIFDVSITPNLIHAASMLGIGREIASFTCQNIEWGPFCPDMKAKSLIEIEVKEKELCPRYTACMVDDVEVKASPEWVIKRLEACGLRSVNNVVDVTNLVMLECGQPLHAFDADLIENQKLVVRKAQNLEKVELLDGKEYHLHDDILVIADKKGPLAVAGVMGAKRAEVSEKTKRIILESAYFQPASVRRASKSLGVRTEASYRFERGIDPLGLETALKRAAQLLQEMKACGSVSEVIDHSSEHFSPRIISCRLSRINRVLGTQLVLGEVEEIFKRLFFKVIKISEENLQVEVPTYRNDVKAEIDLIEEVSRFYGNDHIFKKDRTVYYQQPSLPHNPLYLFSKQVRFHLLGLGLQEFLTCNLISPEEALWVVPDIFPARSLVKIMNPMSLNHSVMRPSLFSNLLNVIKENANHHMSNIAGFELGKIHFTHKDEIKEPFSVAFVLTGDRFPYHWQSKSRPSDFYDLKGMIEGLLQGLKINHVHFETCSLAPFHPGRQAKICIGQQEEIGFMGEVHPQFAEKIGLKQKVYYAELSLNELFSHAEKQIKMKPLPQFPGTTRDWTLTVSAQVSAGYIRDLIYAQKSQILENVMVLDVYQSENLGFDQKNITFRLFYRDQKKTISFEEVEEEQARIINLVSQKVNI